MNSLLYFFLKRANANGKHYSIITIHYALMKSLQPRRRADMGTRARPLWQLPTGLCKREL
ncbi:hypothetical protein [Capnocytophaga leadbetteri]|uniref:hypothetical protein n=1 Tax=Capnocytophaga leadbetteri TaxID=327575 RepID=UPI0028E931F6|nr:hypothetical protein [Capnocytophaga leadbetteri]